MTVVEDAQLDAGEAGASRRGAGGQNRPMCRTRCASMQAKAHAPPLGAVNSAWFDSVRRA